MDILKDIMGLSVSYDSWGKEGGLPFYLSNSFSFQKAKIEGVDCLIAQSYGELPTLPALKKQIIRIQKEENIPVIIKTNGMSAFRKKNMIENKIPFIIGDKQIFLPFIGTYLKNRDEPAFQSVERLTVSAQVLFLLYIYHRGKELYLAEATENLPYSAMTITRAARQLASTGLFRFRKEGVNKVLVCLETKAKLYEKIKPLLSTPIVSVGYISKDTMNEALVLSNVSALAERSMLNHTMPTYLAVGQGEIDVSIMQKELINPYVQKQIEVWKYSPALFSVDNMVDPISLDLSLAGEMDERVEGALEEMLHKLWEGEINGYRI